MVAAVPAPVLEKIVAKIPVGRLGPASAIARGVAFLCSEEAGFVTGSTMSINGGPHMSLLRQARNEGVRKAHAAFGPGPGSGAVRPTDRPTRLTPVSAGAHRPRRGP